MDKTKMMMIVPLWITSINMNIQVLQSLGIGTCQGLQIKSSSGHKHLGIEYAILRDQHLWLNSRWAVNEPSTQSTNRVASGRFCFQIKMLLIIHQQEVKLQGIN